MSSDLPPKRTLKLDEQGGVAGQVAAAVRAKQRPALTVMSGEQVGARLSVIANVRIGRDPDLELVLSDPGVSFRHACIEDRGDAWVLVDLGSTNGSLVNGVRNAEAVLSDGDKLVFGQTIVRFEVQDEHDAAYAEIVSQLLNLDDLTGLYQRRRFDTELAMLITRAANTRTKLSLLAMDLDGVKGINDKHGHLFGAYTISEAGKYIGDVLKGRGIACRFGGDEYIAALPNTDLDSAAALAETIRAGIEQYPFTYDGIPLRPHISIGVAEFPTHAKDAESLFREADAALYAAKRLGKNRVERAPTSG